MRYDRAEAVRGRARPFAAIPVESAGHRFSWPCVPAIAGKYAVKDLLSVGVGAVPLGVVDIASLTGHTTTTPNADTLLPFVRRLYLREPADSQVRGRGCAVTP